MAAPVILVEASPRRAADGAPVTVRLAGGGASVPYRYADQHWRAGLTVLPKSVASLDFDGEQLGGGGTAQAMELSWAPSSRAALLAVAGLYWTDAPISVRVGPEGAELPPIVTAGLGLETSVERGVLKIALADQAVDLKRPVLVDRYLGTGGLEGPSEFTDLIKSRAWGRNFNVPGRQLDAAYNIWVFGDPTRPWQSIDQVRDKGAPAATDRLTVLAWQGSAEATLAALRGTAAIEGGGVLCPSIACVKWWTQPAGDLHADIRGETAGGYVETAPEIVARIVAARSTIPFASGAVAAAAASRPAPFGWRIDTDSATAASEISDLLGGVSTSWLLLNGEMIFRHWDWTAPVRVARSFAASRKSSIKPTASRKLGYRRNWSPMARGDLAAIVLVTDLAYEDGTSFEDLKPAQPGADVTGDHTSKDTNAVGGVPAKDVLDAAAEIKARTDVLENVTIPAVSAAVEQADARFTAAGAAADAAIAAANDRVTAAKATLDQAVQDLANEITRAQGRDEELIRRIDSIEVNGGYDDTNVRALIQSVDTARADGDHALADQIATVITAYGDLDVATNARITQQITVLTDADHAIGQQLDSIVVDYQGRDSATNTRITDTALALADADQAISQKIDAVQASFISGGGNLLSNTDFITTDGWTFSSEAASGGALNGITGPQWWPAGMNALVIGQENTSTDRAGYWHQTLTGIEANQFYQFSVYAASHRCVATLYLDWLSASGDFIGTRALDGIDGNPGDGLISGYRRLYFNELAPANAARARIYLMKQGTRSGPNSYAWFLRPQAAKVGSATAALLPYTPGSSDAVQVATDARVATQVAALADADQAIGQRVDSVTADYQSRDANTNARVDQVSTSSANANQAVADLSTSVSTRFAGVNLTLSGYDQRITSLSTDQQGYVGRTSSLEAQMSRQAPSALNTFTDDVNNRLTQVDTNVNARIKSSEDVIADLPNRYAAASRTATLEAQLAYQAPSGISNAIGAVDGRVTDTSNALVARIEDRATAIADAKAGAVASTLSQLRAEYNGTAASVTQQAGAIVNLQGKASAYVRLVADAGNGRAALSLWSDQFGGAWTLTGDGQIDGNLTVNGTITARKFDRNSMSREGTATWSGYITPSFGQVATIPWSLSLTQIPPVGRFIYEFSTGVTTNAGQRDASTRNGRPYYVDYIADGGLAISAVDGQGNSYTPAPNSSQAVLATTDFVPTWTAAVRNGGYDSGIVDEGDYYIRQISATYVVAYISLKVTWVAI
jgi:hypothetical protein